MYRGAFSPFCEGVRCHVDGGSTRCSTREPIGGNTSTGDREITTFERANTVPRLPVAVLMPSRGLRKIPAAVVEASSCGIESSALLAHKRRSARMGRREQDERSGNQSREPVSGPGKGQPCRASVRRSCIGLSSGVGTFDTSTQPEPRGRGSGTATRWLFDAVVWLSWVS